MGIIKKIEIQHLEDQLARLEKTFEEAYPELVEQGIDRDTWESFEAACDKDD